MCAVLYLPTHLPRVYACIYPFIRTSSATTTKTSSQFSFLHFPAIGRDRISMVVGYLCITSQKAGSAITDWRFFLCLFLSLGFLQASSLSMGDWTEWTGRNEAKGIGMDGWMERMRGFCQPIYADRPLLDGGVYAFLPICRLYGDQWIDGWIRRRICRCEIVV